MINTARFMIAPLQMIYSALFSLCSFTTLKGLFYRKTKRYIIFSLCSGAVMGIIMLIMVLLSEKEINISPVLDGFYLLHTVVGLYLITDRNGDSLFSLIMAEVFSASVMNNMQTAIFSLTYNASESFAITNIMYCVSYVASVIFILLLGLLAKSEEREPISRLNILLLTSTALIAALLITETYTLSDYIPDVSADAIIPTVLILMAITTLLLLSVKSTQVKHFRELNALNEQYMTAQARHFEQARAADEEMRLLRHDMKNHISVLKGLYNSGKMNELKDYLDEISSAINETQAAVFTGNEIADFILADKISLAQASGAEIVVDGSLSGLAIPSAALCAILSNLLDNSIEAVKKLPENKRRIDFSAKRTGRFFYIAIKNLSAEYVEVSREIISSKSDSKNHGLGLKSARKAVNSCGGTLELNCNEISDGYEFTAEVTLPKW